MNRAILDVENVALAKGVCTVYNYSKDTGEYISRSDEYLAVGVGLPAYSCTDAPGEQKLGFAICRDQELNSWQYVPDHRGEIVFNFVNMKRLEITQLGDYPSDTTTDLPLTPYDTWNGYEWVTDHVAIAESKKHDLLENAQKRITIIQMKLLLGRALSKAELEKINSVLNYIDCLNHVNLTKAPDIEWPVL